MVTSAMPAALRATRMTLAPCCANPTAMAFPMPFEAPVMSAVWPCNRPSDIWRAVQVCCVFLPRVDLVDHLCTTGL